MKKTELEAHFIKEVLKQVEIEKPFPSDDFDLFLDMISTLTDDAAKLERQRIADKVKSLKIDQITDHETLYNAILEG